IGLSFYGRFSEQLKDGIQEENQLLIEQVNDACTSYLRNMMKISDSLYYSVIKKTDLSTNSVLDELQLLYDTNKDYIANIALFSTDGKLLEAAPAAVLKPDMNITHQEWLTTALSKTENLHFGSPSVQNLFVNNDARYNWVISLSRAVQITTGNELSQGVLLIDLRYSALTELFSNVFLGNNGYLYLIDSMGNIIYHPQMQLLSSGRIYENNQVAATYHDGNHDETFMSQRRTVTIKSVGYTGWKIVGVTPSEGISLSTLKSNLFILFLLLFCLTVLVMINSYISSRVSNPILELEKAVKQLEEGNLDAHIEVQGFYEVRHLGTAIKNMAVRIRQLMEDIVEEHESKRKSELDTLQSQINPHFLYNTLDIIVWMIENERKTEAVKAVTALARFFRISLSKGKTIITIADELEHVRNYLTIQKMRYKNRFEYTITAEEGTEQLATIKLILQPLVENAIYHGMEFMDG
ncbi:MAG: histidine kinase, partial [Angelakisella sp.]